MFSQRSSRGSGLFHFVFESADLSCADLLSRRNVRFDSYARGQPDVCAVAVELYSFNELLFCGASVATAETRGLSDVARRDRAGLGLGDHDAFGTFVPANLRFGAGAAF